MIEVNQSNDKSTVPLIEDNMKSFGPNNQKNENIDMNEPRENNDSNIIINNKEEIPNPFSNKEEILKKVEDINKNNKDIQIIPLCIQKGKEKKYLLVPKSMTLKEILFINFKYDDSQKITLYYNQEEVSISETIEKLNIRPLSYINENPYRKNNY